MLLLLPQCSHHAAYVSMLSVASLLLLPLLAPLLLPVLLLLLLLLLSPCCEGVHAVSLLAGLSLEVVRHNRKEAL
jgi:hypothetical protein